VKVLLLLKLFFEVILAGEVKWEAAFFLFGTTLLLVSFLDEEDTLFLSPKGLLF
jgi:hypothetical protein